MAARRQVTAINGKSITQPPEYGRELSKYMPGDSISLDIVRENKPMQVNLKLTEYPLNKSHIAYQYEGGKSRRSTGFKKVLVHDAAILPEECGSPVFDSNGKFYGINIARHSRTSSVIMPVGIIESLIRKHLKTGISTK